MIRVLRRPLPLVAPCLVAVAILAVIVRGHNVVTRFDARVVSGIAEHRTTAVVDLARAITNLGAGLPLTIVLAVLCAGLAVLRVLPVRAAVAPLVSLEIGVLLVPLAKSVVERPRPPAALHEVVERSSGFPSGHATQAAAGWLALGLALVVAGRWSRRRTVDAGPPTAGVAPPVRWPLAVTAVVVLLVGVSRVVLSVHSPTDVLAGWLLGLVVAVVVVAVLVPRPEPVGDRPPGKRRMSAPAPHAGGPAASRRPGR